MDLAELPFEQLYVEWAKEITDAPEVYHQAVARLVLSCVVNRKVWLPFGPEKLFPNLYMLIIGPSTLKRKSWSVKLGRKFIREIYPDFEIQETSSRQAFISEYARKDRVPLSAGLIHIDELKGFVDRVKTGGWHQGFFQDLATFYAGERFHRRRGVTEKEKEEFHIESPFLNIAACCSFDWLSQSVEMSDLLGGFFSRFLWIVDNEKVSFIKTHPSPGDPQKYNLLLQKLYRINEYQGEMMISKEADEIYDAWVQEWRIKNQGGQWDSNYDRLIYIAQKLALLHALSRIEATRDELTNPPLFIYPDDIKPAIQFVMRTTLAFKDISIGDSPDDLMIRRVAAKIFKSSTIDHSVLLAGVRNLDAKKLQLAITTLEQAEMIQVNSEKIQNPNGRIYFKTQYVAKKELAGWIQK